MRIAALVLGIIGGLAAGGLGINWLNDYYAHIVEVTDKIIGDSLSAIARKAGELGCRSVAYTYNDPVIFLEPKRLYNGPFNGHHDRPGTPWSDHEASEVPEGHYTVPLGQAEVVQEGSELTIVTYGTLVHVAVAAADATGVDAEVVDVRSISPLDIDTLAESVNKTGRCIVAHEATRFGGYGAELAARIQKECFWNLEAPIGRIAGWDTPYPHAFEWQYFPGKKRMMAGIGRVLEAE